jgi:chromosomal replication initiator protein
MHAWDEFLTSLEKQFGADTVNKWLRSLKVVRFDACNLFLEAKDTFQAMWVEEHILPLARQKLINNNNKKIKVHLSTVNQDKNSSKDSPKERPVQQIPAGFTLTFDTLDPHATLNSFFTSEPNKLTVKVLEQILPPHNELAAYNPIYIYGGSGSGKTHLLMATTHALRAAGVKALYCRSELFTEHVVSAIRGGEMSLFRQAYRNIDVLLLDDVHFFSRKAATQEELFHTFNTLHLSNKQIILSSNCSPNELQNIEPRLVSRFEWGITLPLVPPANEDLMAALQKKAATLQFTLPEKIAQFLIESFPTKTKNLMRALEALVLRLHLNQRSGARPNALLSVSLAKMLLADLIKEEQELSLTPGKIIQDVAEFYGIHKDDILGKAQNRECVLPRQLAMHLIRQELKLSYLKIGDLFQRDHSTVISSVKIIQKALEENDPEVTGAYHPIYKKLKSG